MTGKINRAAVYPTLSVPNVEEACNWYVDKLGFTLRFMWGDPPSHGAVLLEEACVHFWQSAAQPNENWLYFDVDSLDIMYQRALSNDVVVTKHPEDYPWGMREFNATDLNGYKIRFGQHVG
ncbi:MAG: VOC family protein [Pseudomonadota bacterium]